MTPAAPEPHPHDLRQRAAALRSALQGFEAARREFGVSQQEIRRELGGAIDDLRELLRAAGDTRAFRIRGRTTRRKAKA